jgi:hypothetical protein
MRIKVRKIGPGEYEYSRGTRIVRVVRNYYPNEGLGIHGHHWVAYAQWENWKSDPEKTKSAAVLMAHHMLSVRYPCTPEEFSA